MVDFSLVLFSCSGCKHFFNVWILNIGNFELDGGMNFQNIFSYFVTILKPLQIVDFPYIDLQELDL